MDYTLINHYRSKYKRILNAIKHDLEKRLYQFKTVNHEELKGKKIDIGVDFIITAKIIDKDVPGALKQDKGKESPALTRPA